MQSHNVYVQIIILSLEIHWILCPHNMNDFFLIFLQMIVIKRGLLRVYLVDFLDWKKQIYSKLFFVLCCQTFENVKDNIKMPTQSDTCSEGDTG